MLVLNVLLNQRGCCWFRVLPITSKGKDDTGRLKRSMFRIGRLRDYKCDSFIVGDDYRKLPENMVHRVDGRVRIIDSIDLLTFQHIVKTATLHCMGSS